MICALLKRVQVQFRQIQHLQKRIRRLNRARQELEERVQQLQRAGFRQAAPFRRPEHRKIPAEQQTKPGRKAGHPGSYRPIPETLDEEVEVPLTGCPHCGGPIENLQPILQYIEEIPVLRPRVSKITTYRGECSACGPVHSQHPLQTSQAQGAAQVQLGPRALSLAADLNKSCGLTMRTTCRVLQQLVGLRLTPGGLSQALERVARRVEPLYTGLIEKLRQAPAVFVDETSWWVGGPGWWLWVFTSPDTTVYVVRPNRGSQVVAEILGEKFPGRLVSDCLSSYDPLPYAKHKCIAHHLKAISEARQLRDTRDPEYLQQWRLFFTTVLTLHSVMLSQGVQDWTPRIRGLEQWRDRLLARSCVQRGDRSIQKRLDKQRPHLLGCLYDTAAEPTNNRAERALRPAVIARKLSSGNKTTRGKQTWEVPASVAATCRQRENNLYSRLGPCLEPATPVPDPFLCESRGRIPASAKLVPANGSTTRCDPPARNPPA